MAKGKPAFAPVPLGAISDGTLTALELRVLACISWHDRLSSSRGSKGCYASNKSMAQRVGCTIHSLSRAISVLVKKGYVERDYRSVPGKRHLTVYRVIYEEAPVVQRDKCSSGSALEGGAEGFVQAPERNPAFSVSKQSQEISLSEGIDSGEPGEKNSIEMAHQAVRGSAGKGRSAPEEHAIMAQIERRLRPGVSLVERRNMLGFLKPIHENGQSTATRYQALRLIDEIHELI